MDLYTDHMVRYFYASGVPLERIDNTGFMVGVAGTCYSRRMQAWKGMLLLEHARGGWMNVYYGNLELIDDVNARWFAKVQKLCFALQSSGRTYPFGNLPGKGGPYGFSAVSTDGALYTLVNPSQTIASVKLPRVHRSQPGLAGGRVQFRDAGFEPKLAGDELRLGPEQMAVVGFGEYARAKYDLGVQEDVLVPAEIRRLDARFVAAGTNAVTATLNAPKDGTVRIIMRQIANGKPLRTSRGAPPDGITLGRILQIQVFQENRSVPVEITYDKALWSGLSWGVGEVKTRNLNPDMPITVRCVSLERRPVELQAEVYVVNYR